MDAVILERNGTAVEIPPDGSFIDLSDSQVLLITNGRPEIDKQGVPSPIYVEVVNPGRYTPEEIFRGIYQNTFLHPASLEKTKLPLVVHASRRRLRQPHEILMKWSDEGVYL